MKITVTGRHVEVSTATRAQIQRKLAPLVRVLNDHLLSVQCVLSKDGKQVVCDLSAHVRGDHTLHAIGRDSRMAAAVAAAVDKTRQQATRLAGKWKKRRRDGAGAAAPEAEAPPLPRRAAIVRGAGYSRRPMSVDDAALALASSRQSFVAFRDAASGEVVILNRRPDGRLELIEPEA